MLSIHSPVVCEHLRSRAYFRIKLRHKSFFLMVPFHENLCMFGYMRMLKDRVKVTCCGSIDKRPVTYIVIFIFVHVHEDFCRENISGLSTLSKASFQYLAA